MDSKEKLEKIKQQIFENIKLFYKESFKEKHFIPGKTKINYGGRVFDEEELISLIDSSLEFWLTEGRYAQKFKKALSSFIGVSG